MNKGNFKPFTHVDQYMNKEFNIEIYRELTEDPNWQGIFEPLKFLNLLYEQFEIVKANKNNPTSVVKHLSGLGLDEKKYYFLLNNLSNLINKTTENISDFGNSAFIRSKTPEEEQLDICNTFISTELAKVKAKFNPKIENKEEPEEEEENKYDFEKVKQHLETIPEVTGKIKYLIGIKTDFLQQKCLFDSEYETPFDKKCDLEIDKLESFLKLDDDTKPNSKSQLGEYTNSQLVLIFYYFFKFHGLEPRKTIDIAPIAKFIHLIVGKDFKSVTSSDYYNKLKQVPNFNSDTQLIKDLEKIKFVFQKVQLNDVLILIDKELEIARNEIKQSKK